MTESNVIKLDWYGDYDIVIPSTKSGEAYSTVGGFKIDQDWGGMRELKNGYQAIYHKTFMFRVAPWLNNEIITKFLVNVEKIYLLKQLGVNGLPPVERLIKAGGEKVSAATEELVEDVADMFLNELLKEKTKDKEIYYFQRAKWRIHNEHNEIIRARFNFLILDK